MSLAVFKTAFPNGIFRPAALSVTFEFSLAPLALIIEVLQFPFELASTITQPVPELTLIRGPVRISKHPIPMLLASPHRSFIHPLARYCEGPLIFNTRRVGIPLLPRARVCLTVRPDVLALAFLLIVGPVAFILKLALGVE